LFHIVGLVLDHAAPYVHLARLARRPALLNLATIASHHPIYRIYIAI
jgi:hypothetical protein